MKGLALIFTLLALALAMIMASGEARAAGSPLEQLFNQANEAHSRGDHRQAIALYQEVAASGGSSANLLLNLGNSHALAGQIGRAVLAYERGLRLAPDDPDLKGNLRLLRQEKGLFVEPPQGWRPWQLLSLDRWAGLAVTALLLLALALLVPARISWLGKWRLQISLALLAVLLVASGGVGARYRAFNPSVVIAEDARLLLSPFPASASVGAIQEGRLVTVEKRHGDYCFVADEVGRRGWLAAAQLETVRNDGGLAPAPKNP